MGTTRQYRSYRASTSPNIFISVSTQHSALSTSLRRLLSLRSTDIISKFTASACFRRTLLLFIIPPFILLPYLALFTNSDSAIHETLSFIFTTSHYLFAMGPTSYDHTNYTTSHIQIHYSRLKFRGGNTYVFKGKLAGTVRIRNRWTGALGGDGVRR